MTYVFLALLALPILILGASIVFGGPPAPPEKASINDPFKSVDFSQLPELTQYVARDGSSLAYRRYDSVGAEPKGSVVLVHGSSASSESMHVTASGFADAGYVAYALDIRGHGASGEKGKIGYIGQLEDDLEDFVTEVNPEQPSTLSGFSSGGGFVLRFAGSDRQSLFSNYLLQSPFLGPNAPNYRSDAGGWVGIGLPRMIALSILNSAGITRLNDLPTLSFALADEVKSQLTPEYSYALAENFGPLSDYKLNIQSVNQLCSLVAGDADEVFYTEHLESIVQGEGKPWSVTLVPGVGHIGLTLESAAIDASIRAVTLMGDQR